MPPNIRSGNPFLSTLLLIGATLLAALSLAFPLLLPFAIAVACIIALTTTRPGRRSRGADGTTALAQTTYGAKMQNVGDGLNGGGAGWKPRLGTTAPLATVASGANNVLFRLGRRFILSLPRPSYAYTG